MPTETEILAIARRETAPEYCNEFEPIARGPLFAILALIPLGALAALSILWRKMPWNRRS